MLLTVYPITLPAPCLLSQGFVFLRFASVEGAQAAQRALNGRFYSGKQIVAQFQFAQVYNSFFGI